MLLSPEELKKSSEMDPQILEFAQKNPSPPVEWENAAAVNAMIGMVEQSALEQLGPAESSMSEKKQKIPMRDEYQSTIKIHKPAEPPAAGSPLIVLLFGGGFISGSCEQMTPTARGFVRAFGAVAITIDYRLAPEHKYPVAFNDCWDSVKWIADHASELGADPSKGFVIGGISAGGCSTATTVLHSLEEKLAHPITGQWLGVPLLMDHDKCPEKYKKHFLSREHNHDAPILSTPALDAIMGHFGTDRNSTLLYPILSKAPLDKVPPTFFQVCGMDPIRDDALIYEEVLKDAGVKTRLNFYPGAPHAHWGFMPGIEISTRAIADSMTGMGWLLGKEITAEEGLKALAPPS